MREFLELSKSYEISYAGAIATELAFLRKKPDLNLQDYFGGLYLIDRESLVPYWNVPHSLDKFVRNVCGLDHPPWFYWIEIHDQFKNRIDGGVMGTCSDDLSLVLAEVGRIAKELHAGEAKIEITLLDLMTVIASHPEMEFTRKMTESGFRVPNRGRS